MRDLASRLRDIVRQNPPPAPRELTYVADAEGGRGPDEMAARLGGAVHESAAGRCVVIDRHWRGDDWHGGRRVATLVPPAHAPLALFDTRLSGLPDWTRHVIFFDIETTGLSGGAGTLAFLAGCGWFEDDGFSVRQFFLNGPSAERAMLDALAGVFARASLLVTYNGRSFDVPAMETRWAFHRTPCPTDDLPHFDMLPSARRLWGGTSEGAGQGTSPAGCSLTSLERTVLGFHRTGDVPGCEIPARYFHFLRSGDADAVQDVLQHNRLDLISLAAVTARALELGHEGPEACRHESEQMGLGRLYERAGDLTRAAAAYRLAASSGDDRFRGIALGRLAELLRRTERHDEAAGLWRQLLDGMPRGRRELSRVERRAAEALAIHLEHRVKDPVAARHVAELLQLDAGGRRLDEVEHRLGRLDRKLQAHEAPARLRWRT